MAMLCEVCEIEPAHPATLVTGLAQCVDCAHGRCGSERCDAEIDWNPDFEPDEPDELCDSCAAKEKAANALQTLKDTALDSIESAGWNWHLQSVAQTGTCYYDVWRYRKCEECIDDFKLRIADHGTAHCSEDISLVSGQPNMDDHSLETLQRWLTRPVPACEDSDCQSTW
jgi:hypothetical protein